MTQLLNVENLIIFNVLVAYERCTNWMVAQEVSTESLDGNTSLG